MAAERPSAAGRLAPNAKRALPYLALLAALLPVGLYAWLGQYIRPIIDDYYTLRIGRELGAWDGMRFHLNTWSGGYSNFFIKSAMAPLDTLAPAATTWLLTGMWLLAALWLARGLLPRLGIARPAKKLQLILAASIVTASIYAQYSPQTIYWHAAVIGYMMPVTILTMNLGLLANSPLCAATRSPIAWRVLIAMLLCFLSAGFSESFGVLQATALTMCLCIAPLFCHGQARRNIMLLLGSGWLATLLSLLLQANMPGVALRIKAESLSIGLAIGDYADRAVKTVDLAARIMGHPPAYAGFAFLFFVSFGATVCYARPGPSGASNQAYRLSRRLLGLGLLAQLLLLLLLWNHRSDVPQIFGRFSMAYSVVIGVNTLQVACYAFALWQWRRIGPALARGPRSAWLCFSAIVAAALILFGLTQLTSVHWRAASSLYLSTLVLLALLAGQLSSWLQDPRLRKLFALAVVCTLIAWLLYLETIFIAYVLAGFMRMRLLALASSATVLSGLAWGACLGCLIKQWAHERIARQAWIWGLVAFSAAGAFLIGAVIVSSQLRLAPDFAGYASEWDDRHQAIIEQRDRGERDITAQPLNFNMPGFLRVSTQREILVRYALGYYGVDSIAEVDS